MWCAQVLSQNTLIGEVLDAISGEPLIGANVLIAGTSIGTVADFDGSFALKIDQDLPVTIEISYLGYTTKNVEITSLEKISIPLDENAITTEIVEVTGQRISEKQKAAPLTVESLDLIAIKETPSDNFYDGLGSLKGVDLTAASLGFKIINTRGFNSTSPVRSLQIIDGVDNQAPGLNFSLGNFLGSSELDVLKVDLVQGASSAFYGPNAFNGVISMTTKNPFYQKGLSVQLKAGERSLFEGAMRWADALKNKDGKEWFGYKLNFFALRANDWVADNYNAVDGTDAPVTNPGGYDAVNRYGDEYYSGNDYSTADPWSFPGLGVVHRNGYNEIDLVDYNTRNVKANAGLYFRLKPELEENSPELMVVSSFGTGTTVYQGDNRFSLKNILFFQNRIELNKRDKYFIRAYATNEDAGDSYDPYFTALQLQRASKSNLQWSIDYLDYWLRNNSKIINESGYPQLEVSVDPNTGQIKTFFDRPAATQWLIDNNQLVTSLHQTAHDAANRRSIAATTAFFVPGTPAFDEKFREIITTSRNNGGTLFTDRSALYHVHGEYTFTPTFLDKWVVGANARIYRPVSEGTLFTDFDGEKIKNSEFGIYSGVEKNINDGKWRFSATARMDKNENFPVLVSPAASIVWKPRPGNYLRTSFSSAIRNPTLTDQYLFLNVGRAILAGNLDGVSGLATIESLIDFFGTLDARKLKYFSIDPVRPEKVRTFEVGYRSTLFNSLFIDVGYYFSRYTDFLGYNIGADIKLDPQTNFPTNLQIYRYSANSTEVVKTQGLSAGANLYFADFFALNANYSWNKLISKTEDPIIPAFNTPEHKYNIGISGRDITARLGSNYIRNFGFNINYKWIEGFIFEGSPQFTGIIPSYSLMDAQVNWRAEKLNTTFKIGASNILDNKQFQTYGGPRIGRLAYVSLLYEWKKK